jgi:hypothetical protein
MPLRCQRPSRWGQTATQPTGEEVQTVKRLLVVMALAATVTGAFPVGHVSAHSAAAYNLRVNDYAFVNNAGLVCRDQLLTALKATRPFARTLGRYALECRPSPADLFNVYSVRISELGIVVER